MDWSRVDRPPVDEMEPLKEDTLVYGSAWKRGERREIIKEDVVPRRERDYRYALLNSRWIESSPLGNWSGRST